MLYKIKKQKVIHIMNKKYEDTVNNFMKKMEKKYVRSI